MSAVTARGLARSSLQMNVLQLCQMASRFMLTPMIIARLGLEGYGVWILLFSLCSYATALNTGVVWAYVKQTAELDERRDYSMMSEVISSGASAMTALAVAMLGALWLGCTALLPRIGVPSSLLPDAQLVLAVLAVAVVIQIGPGCALHLLAGLQRTDLQYRFLLAGSLADFATAFVLLASGYGMVSLASGFFAGEVVAAAAAWIVCHRMRPALAISPWRARFTGLRRLLPLGVRLQGVVLLNNVVRESVRLSLSSLYGATALGIYQLADRVLLVARFPVQAIVGPLMPAFSGIAAQADASKGRRLFAQASTIAAVVSGLSLSFAALFADAILLAWTGREFPDAAWTVRVLAPAELGVLLTGVAIAALRAAGSVSLELRFAVAAGILALAGIVLGNPVAGYAGSIIALAAGRCGAAGWFFSQLPLMWTLDRREYARRTLLRSAATVTPVVLIVKALSSGFPSPGGRWEALGALTALAGVSAVAVGAITWLVLLTKNDRVALLKRP
jgi:O-antigen/teichoic acid export membrane protein